MPQQIIYVKQPYHIFFMILDFFLYVYFSDIFSMGSLDLDNDILFMFETMILSVLFNKKNNELDLSSKQFPLYVSFPDYLAFISRVILKILD